MTHTVSHLPAARGHFGPFGGRFVPETLIPALDELEAEYALTCQDEAFQRELRETLREYVGRPTPLTRADRLSASLGGPSILLKLVFFIDTGSN